MKIDNVFKSAIYLVPSLLDEAFCCLFWVFYFKNKINIDVGWITPMIAISWVNGLQVWFLWLNGGFVINLFNKKRIIQKALIHERLRKKNDQV